MTEHMLLKRALAHEGLKLAMFLGSALLLGVWFGHMTGWLLLAFFGYLGALYHALFHVMKAPHLAVPGRLGIAAFLEQRFQQQLPEKTGSGARTESAIRQIAAQLPDAVLLLGGKNRIIWSNPAAQKLLGVRWPEDNGMRLENLWRDPKLNAFLGDEASTEALRLTSPVVIADSAPVRLDVHCVSHAGRRLMVARDATREETFGRAQRDFVANASHELRTPLMIISGYLESLEEALGVLHGKHEHDLMTLLKPMRTQTDRMAHTIGSLLTLHRLESCVTPARAPVGVPSLLDLLRDELSHLVQKKQLQLGIVCDHHVDITGDARDIQSAFTNLLVNAIQHTDKGGTIQLHWYADERGAHLKVKDSGVGIASEHVSRISDRFYRVHATGGRRVEGAGLGLAIVRQALLNHGASLVIESAPGEGTCVCCNFPPASLVTPLPTLR